MKNKLVTTITIIFVLVVIGLSFYNVINDYMPNLFEYRNIEKSCPSDAKICKQFKTKEELEFYLQNRNPKKIFDAITLSSYVVETAPNFGIMVFLSPLIMILLVVFRIQDEITSGYIENLLTRMNYKNLLKRYILIAAKTALLIPIIYLLILFISCLITDFNFTNITTNMVISPLINTLKYNNFLVYSIILLSTQYLLHFAYALIGVFISFASKSKIISIIS